MGISARALPRPAVCAARTKIGKRRRLPNPSGRRGRSEYLVRVGIMGYDHWSPNLIRSVSRCDACALTRIVDPTAQGLDAARRERLGTQLAAAAADMASALLFVPVSRLKGADHCTMAAGRETSQPKDIHDGATG